MGSEIQSDTSEISKMRFNQLNHIIKEVAIPFDFTSFRTEEQIDEQHLHRELEHCQTTCSMAGIGQNGTTRLLSVMKNQSRIASLLQVT